MATLIFVGDRLQLREPCGRFAVGWRAPIAARRQRSARADLGRVGNRAALELAQLEEAVQESMQMSLDSRDVVLVAAVGRDIRPMAGVLVVPRVVRQERDLRRRVSEAKRVVEVEIVQLVGPIVASVSWLGCPSSEVPGISSGLIGVATISSSVALVCGRDVQSARPIE